MKRLTLTPKAKVDLGQLGNGESIRVNSVRLVNPSQLGKASQPGSTW